MATYAERIMELLEGETSKDKYDTFIKMRETMGKNYEKVSYDSETGQTGYFYLRHDGVTDFYTLLFKEHSRAPMRKIITLEEAALSALIEILGSSCVGTIVTDEEISEIKSLI